MLQDVRVADRCRVVGLRVGREQEECCPSDASQLWYGEGCVWYQIRGLTSSLLVSDRVSPRIYQVVHEQCIGPRACDSRRLGIEHPPRPAPPHSEPTEALALQRSCMNICAAQRVACREGP